ncbi:hypothetical protein [Helicobacter cholecystus]|uniref:hypothetical protein n=1 Tax=Helicobacter cholecystus TaxID=45498 RepID=UPI002739AE0D|nr:hypothetical protein [Helicobacter cholecystus]
MNMKNDFKTIKEEISNDEKMLEGIFRIETFIKKYKFLLIALGVVLCAWIAYIWTEDYFKEQKAIASTKLMQQIQANPQDAQAWNSLKEKNDTLYEMLKFSQALLQNNADELEGFIKSKNTFIAHYANYEVATFKKSFTTDNFGEFSPLALLQEGFLALKEKNRTLALQKLAEISNDSDLREFANRIGHYGL